MARVIARIDMPQSRRPTKESERARLKKVIAEWNASRLDMFAMSDPSEVSASSRLYLPLYLIFPPSPLTFHHISPPAARLSTGLGVPWRHALLFSRRKPPSVYQVCTRGELGHNAAGDQRAH